MNEFFENLRSVTRENRKNRKKQFLDGFEKYGLIILAVVGISLIAWKSTVPYECFTIHDVSRTDTKLAEGWFVAGTMDSAHRYASSAYTFDAETGVCKITIKEYSLFGFMGGNDFVVYIEADPDAVKEIWYVNDTQGSEEEPVLLMKNGDVCIPTNS